jgi:glucose/arabinose dehydrogenase
MMKFKLKHSVIVILLLSTGSIQAQTELIGFGANPILPEPNPSIIPTVDIADAVGWKDNAKPIAAEGFEVQAFAKDLQHPRWLYVLPNGNLLVAETNAPAKPEDGKGIKGFFMKLFMKRAGAAVETPNKIILLSDTNGDGVADTRNVLLENLNSPFGMAYQDGYLYIAESDAILRFPYNGTDEAITQNGEKIADLPGGPINHHWTKNIIASEDGKYLYATVGSNSNIAENGMDKEVNRAAILRLDLSTRQLTNYASGIRNPNGLAWQPDSHQLWVAVNERDQLGNDLVPDYITSVKEGAFYGWPYSYYGQHVDPRVKPQNPELVAKAISPDYAVGAHAASLGLTFYTGDMFPKSFKNGAFIGQHGSWNRKPLSGYKVIFVAFENGMPQGMPIDILTGFVDQEGHAQGRPVGVVVDKKGALLVADDVGNAIWRVTPRND